MPGREGLGAGDSVPRATCGPPCAAGGPPPGCPPPGPPWGLLTNPPRGGGPGTVRRRVPVLHLVCADLGRAGWGAWWGEASSSGLTGRCPREREGVTPAHAQTERGASDFSGAGLGSARGLGSCLGSFSSEFWRSHGTAAAVDIYSGGFNTGIFFLFWCKIFEWQNRQICGRPGSLGQGAAGCSAQPLTGLSKT